MEVLTAYVREKARWAVPPEGWETDWNLTDLPSTPIQAILTVLSRRNANGEDIENGLNLSYTDLKRVELKGILAVSSQFYRVHLEGASLYEANLQSAFLRDSHLDNVSLVNANLCEANLENCTFQHSILDGANLEQARLHGADLEWANLFQTNLKGANLARTNLQHANLRKANLEGAYLANALLDETYLDGANLQSVHGLTQDQLSIAYWDEHTQFPDGFEPPPMRKD